MMILVFCQAVKSVNTQKMDNVDSILDISEKYNILLLKHTTVLILIKKKRKKLHEKSNDYSGHRQKLKIRLFDRFTDIESGFQKTQIQP